MVTELVLPRTSVITPESKSYFDAAVRVDDSLISVRFYEPTRREQDIDAEIETSRLFTLKRLLVVERVTIDNMQSVLAIMAALGLAALAIELAIH